MFSFSLPDDTVLQTSSNDVDRDALWLVGERHGADGLPAMDVSDQVAVHRPQAKVAAARLCTHTPKQDSRHGPERTSVTLTRSTINRGAAERTLTRVTNRCDVSCGLAGRDGRHGTFVAREALNVTESEKRKKLRNQTKSGGFYSALTLLDPDLFRSQRMQVPSSLTLMRMLYGLQTNRPVTSPVCPYR